MFKKFFEFIVSHAIKVQNMGNFVIDKSTNAIFYASLVMVLNKAVQKFAKFMLKTIAKAAV